MLLPIMLSAFLSLESDLADVGVLCPRQRRWTSSMVCHPPACRLRPPSRQMHLPDNGTSISVTSAETRRENVLP
jgi:hypothetical protein